MSNKEFYIMPLSVSTETFGLQNRPNKIRDCIMLPGCFKKPFDGKDFEHIVACCHLIAAVFALRLQFKDRFQFVYNRICITTPNHGGAYAIDGEAGLLNISEYHKAVPLAYVLAESIFDMCMRTASDPLSMSYPEVKRKLKL